MGFIKDLIKADKLISKFFPLLSVAIFCSFIGFKWASSNSHVFSSFSQDLAILFILTNQAVIVSYQTYYKE
ncbi:MAG: hypothetical protein CMG62_11035 [Candidatus Marinimicrobia bacterium]|nr:hypothetical protein [Candidatus Neomarinimicrobiota bacterium]|tara:strand:- start:3495 stop:3707 length:213 start_codon:yes stop_codon:yes gene_type:complete